MRLCERLAKHLHPAGAWLIGTIESRQDITFRSIRKVSRNPVFYQLRYTPDNEVKGPRRNGTPESPAPDTTLRNSVPTFRLRQLSGLRVCVLCSPNPSQVCRWALYCNALCKPAYYDSASPLSSSNEFPLPYAAKKC